jgi:hypothetical protein
MREREGEPVDDKPLPKPPKYLTAEERHAWRDVVRNG